MSYMFYSINDKKKLKKSLLKKINYVLGARFCNRSLRSRTKSAGFTLVELIVAVFIFSVLVMFAGGSTVSALSLQRRALNIKKVEENGKFVLELMARELRVANPINTINSSCPSSFSLVLNFEHPINGTVEYSLAGTAVHRRVNGVDTIISNPDVEITRLKFCVSGNSVGDNQQPRVNIILGLRAGGSSNEAAVLDLQTTVSQRFLSD